MMSNLPSSQKAKEAASAGDTKTALTILRDLIKQNPRSVDAWLTLAEIVEQPEQAKQCLERVLQIDPNNQIAQQKLLGEQPDEFDFLFETADEPNQEPEDHREDVPALDFSNLYTQEDPLSQSDFRQNQPEPTITEPIQPEDRLIPSAPTPITPGEVTGRQQPPKKNQLQRNEFKKKGGSVQSKLP